MLHSGMVLAAPQSGSGKTTITCALLAAMKNRKFAVRAFKSGPDYIDPMFHRQVYRRAIWIRFFQGQIRSGNCMDMTGRAFLIR